MGRRGARVLSGLLARGPGVAAPAHLRVRGTRERGRARAARSARHRGRARAGPLCGRRGRRGRGRLARPRTATLALADGCARVRAGDLARGFVHACHDVLRIGQHVRARVRELAPDGTPWLDLQPFQADEVATIAEQAGPGDVVRVRVRRRSNNGYQVELLPGADAFVPLQHCPAEIEAERDDVLAARIVRLDVADRRIVVSLADAPASAEGARPLRLYPDGPVFLASDDVAGDSARQRAGSQREELSDVACAPRAGTAEADALEASATGWPRSCARSACGPARWRPTSAARPRADRPRVAAASRGAVDPDAFLAWLGVAHAKLHDPPERARYPLRRVVVGTRFLESLRDLQGISLHQRARCLRPRRDGARRRDPRARAASAARRCRGVRAAPARRRRARLALRAAGALPVGAPAALLAARGRRRRARPRGHSRRGHLRRPGASAGEGEERAGALQRALLVGELALERARLGARERPRPWPRRAAARPRRRVPRACAARP